MDDIFEKKLKEFLPYIIIIGIVYLFTPAIIVLTKSTGVFNQIMYMGIFPLAAFLCNLHYGYKKINDFFLSLVAPVIYIPSMLLYGNLRDSVVNSIIFLVSYFICGYLGLTVGDMIRTKSSDEEKEQKSKNSAHKRTYDRNRVATSVRTPERETENNFEQLIDDIEMPSKFSDDDITVEEPVQSVTSTEDDIDAILAELHNRHE